MAGVGWLVMVVGRVVRRGRRLRVRGLVAVRIGRPSIVQAGWLWRPLVAGVAGVANFDSRFGRAAMLREFGASRFIQQADFHASVAAAGKLLVGGGDRLVAGCLAKSQSLVTDAQLFEVAHDGQTPFVGELP